jgi:aspartate/methionine/tyrosine aminotransferase
VLEQVVVERDMIVICDEGDSKMVYDDEKHWGMATFPSVDERFLTVYGSQERMLSWIFESAVSSG